MPFKAADVKRALAGAVDPVKAAFYPRFFKAGKGEYAEGDRFLGVVVVWSVYCVGNQAGPQSRVVQVQ